MPKDLELLPSKTLRYYRGSPFGSANMWTFSYAPAGRSAQIPYAKITITHGNFACPRPIYKIFSKGTNRSNRN